jgi:hypothetical protein
MTAPGWRDDRITLAENIVEKAREASRAYFAFHEKYQHYRRMFSKETTELAAGVEQANVEMVTAMFNLQEALNEWDMAGVPV